VLFIIHNFIRIHQSIPDAYSQFNDEEIIMVQEEEVLAANEHPDQNRGLESQWRDTIAQDMWNDYLIYIENNNL
jgi:hypothetical protein